MADSVVPVKGSTAPDHWVDNETAANAAATGGVADRQRVAAYAPGGAALATEATLDARLGALDEAAPGSDTASAGVNGRLQRIAQRLSSLIGLLPAALGAGGGLKVDGSGTALPVSGTFFPATQPVSGTFFQATQPVSATDLDVRDLALTQDSVRQTTRTMTPLSTTVTGPVTDEVLVAVSGAQRIRVLKNAGHCDPALTAGTYPVVTLKVGSTVIFTDKLEPGLPWAEQCCFEGALDEDLTITLTTTGSVFLNMRYEIF